MKQLVKMKLIMIILMFFLVSALLIVSNHNLKMHEEENVNMFCELYLDWIDKIYFNMQSITGEVIDSEWFPASPANSNLSRS